MSSGGDGTNGGETDRVRSSVVVENHMSVPRGSALKLCKHHELIEDSRCSKLTAVCSAASRRPRPSAA